MIKLVTLVIAQAQLFESFYKVRKGKEVHKCFEVSYKYLCHFGLEFLYLTIIIYRLLIVNIHCNMGH